VVITPIARAIEARAPVPACLRIRTASLLYSESPGNWSLPAFAQWRTVV